MPSASHPISRGSLCLKGWTSFQHLRRPERLESPHIRVAGTMRQVPWDEALSRVTEGLADARLKYGGESVGFLVGGRATNEEVFLVARIAGEGIGTKAIWCDPGLQTLEHVPVGLVEGPLAARLEDIPRADVLVIFGQGLAEHHPQAAARILKAADGGTKLVVVSHCRDLLAGQATIHVAHRDPETVAFALADPKAGAVEAYGRLWCQAERPVLIYPLKSLPLPRETALLRSLEMILARRPAKVLLLFPRANSRGVFLYQKGGWPREGAALKALVVIEENPAAWDGNFQAWSRELDFLVVQDLFPTETSELAHVVLPGASFAEKGGTLTNTEGRQQELQPVVVPPGAAKPGWAILAELARRLEISGVGTTLDEIRAKMAAEAVQTGSGGPMADTTLRSVDGSSTIAHAPDRLGYMWLKDTVLRHTDDWQREHQDQWIEVHPEDAKALSLRPGWTVRIAGAEGDFTATVRISERVRRGLVCSPHALVEGPVTLDRAA